MPPVIIAAGALVGGLTLAPVIGAVAGLGLIGGAIVGAGVGALIGAEISSIAFHGGSTGGAKPVQRLNKTINPEEPRKIVFGKTAAALDLRFWEVWGPSGTYYDEVIALASHRINSVQEFYLENALALDASGTAPAKYTDSYGQTQGGYNGVLTRSVNLGTPGQSALSVGSGSQWTSACKFDGVAHMCLHWVPNDKQLPNGIPSRYTQVIEGAPVYDPRRDSTVPGGSGSHRINDQTTWDYAALDSNGVPIGRNNALQVLWYLLGWRIANAQTGEMVLVCGRGVDTTDINLATFITAANNCEAAGYYTDGAFSTGDAHTDNEDKLTASGLIGTLIDPGGLWSYYANVDDTANIDAYLSDDDITDNSATTWSDFYPMSEQFVQVAGKFNDPGPLSLYQARAYPLVRDTTYESNLGVKRRKTIDFDVVQDSLLAQKLARLALNTGQYQGEFNASMNYRVMKAQVWSVVSYTSARFGWTKLFRIRNFTITPRDGVQLALREINSSIWAAGSVVSPAAISAGKKYDPRQEVAVAGLAAAAYTSTASNGAILDGMLLSWTMPPSNVLRTEIQYQQSGASSWESPAPINGDTNSVAIANLLSGTTYNVRARHITNFEIESAWVNLSPSFTTGTARVVLWSTVAGTPNAPNNSAGATFRSVIASPPASPGIGDYWTQIDNNNATFRYEGAGLVDGASSPLTDGGGASLDGPWVPILDQTVLSVLALVTAQNTTMIDATTAINAIQSDGILARGEKPEANRQYNVILGEYAGWVAQASSYSITTELTAYQAAYAALVSYVASVPNFADTTSDTAISASAFSAAFNNYYTAKATLLAKITAVSGTVAAWSGVTGTGKPEDSADVTSAITGAPAVNINADYTGAITDALPRNVVYQLIRQGTDVSGSTTWSVAVVSGVLAASITGGTLALSASSGSFTSGKVRITGIYGSTTRTFDVAVNVVKAPPPNTGARGGTSASGNTNGTTNSTTPTAIGDVLQVTVGSGGQVALSASYSYTSAGSGTLYEVAQWYRWNGSAYVAIGSSVTATDPYIAADGSPGLGACSYTDTGLTASSTQKYRLYCWNSTGSVSRTISGTCAAVGS